jgi:8-oxo-dGTP pyrophosphatase MutT (NUDIX family)
VEWFTGVSTTIEGLLDETRCPELTHLDLVLLSVAPGLTGTAVAWSDPEDGREGDRLRMTFIIDGSQPEDIPTLVASRRADHKEDGSIFEAFQAMIDQVGRRTPSALRFVLKRPNYTRPDVGRFTRHLQKVSNHPKVGPRDRTFQVGVDLDRSPPDGGGLSPFEVAKAIRDGGGATAFRARWDRPDDRLTLAWEGRRSSEATAIRGDHLLACFALMTWGDDLVLVEHKKGGWECDVPGGKVSSIDGTEQDALVREVFEELGLLLTAERLSAPIGWKYDPKSAREAHKPVIAQYYHYPLTRDEITYLFDVVGETTKGNPLVRFPLTRLLQEKRTSDRVIEAVCHAPLWAVEGLVQILEGDR